MRVGAFFFLAVFFLPLWWLVQTFPWWLLGVAVVMNCFAPIEWLRAIYRALDHLHNALIGGSAYESISSRAWRERDRPWARFVIWFTDLLQKGHCEGANAMEQPRLDRMEGK